MGAHSVSTVTTRGSLLYLFVASATEKQWNKPGVQAALRAAVDSFRA